MTLSYKTILLRLIFRPVRLHLSANMGSMYHHDTLVRQCHCQLLAVVPPCHRQMHWLVSILLFVRIFIDFMFADELPGLLISIARYVRQQIYLYFPNEQLAVPSSSRYQTFRLR